MISRANPAPSSIKDIRTFTTAPIERRANRNLPIKDRNIQNENLQIISSATVINIISAKIRVMVLLSVPKA